MLMTTDHTLRRSVTFDMQCHTKTFYLLTSQFCSPNITSW